MYSRYVNARQKLDIFWKLIDKQSLQSDTFKCNVRAIGALMPSL